MQPNCDKERDAVFVISEELPTDSPIVQGYEFKVGEPVDYERLFAACLTTGFQATNLAKAIGEVRKMLQWRGSQSMLEPGSDEPVTRPAKCTIFLGYTSNLVSSGLRDVFRFLVQNKMVDAIVTSAGGIEEDFIKCLAPLYLGDFDLDGKSLRSRGLNRIGNLLMPNRNYCVFENWVMPILDRITDELNAAKPEDRVNWTPSKLIDRLGSEINDPQSIYYWAHRNQIPVFCPAITDGSLGDMIYFHSFRKAGLTLDLVEDIRRLNGIAVFAPCTGMIILGGGVTKHHICNANLMRNGADYAVFINTGQEFDGSDSGASPDEAVSWGKIKVNATPVKVSCDATLVFPIIVAETFAKNKN